MNAPNLLQLLREKASAVQVVVQEIDDLAQACRYAVDLTKSQGGATLAAPGWDPGTLPVNDNLRFLPAPAPWPGVPLIPSCSISNFL